MKEITIKIYEWSDLKKWCSDLKKWLWDLLCFPRRNLVAEWLDYYGDEARSLVERILLKYNKEDLEKDNYALLSNALEEWDVEIKKIRDRTEEFIMMK